MWKRLAATRLGRLSREFPAVLIIGARQVGKTTLARQTWPRLPYCDLENPNMTAMFREDPVFQIESRLNRGIVLDEAQAVPDLFAALRGIIDRKTTRTQRIVLLGSANPLLLRQVSETLAGRVGILELDPLVAEEAGAGSPRRTWKHVWLRGGFPRALRGAFRDWWEAYLRTYVERDLRALGVETDPLLMRRLLTMLAHMQGGLLNSSQLSNSLGVSHNTVRRYLDILEYTFLIRRLPPYFTNVGKRLTKSPKVYIRDTGLLHHLLNISSPAELESHPIRGASWETFVIEDILRREKVRHPFSQAYFWRTQAGAEVDLVIDRGSERIGLEVKTGAGQSAAAAKRLAESLGDFGASHGYVLDQSAGADALAPGIRRIGYPDHLTWLP